MRRIEKENEHRGGFHNAMAGLRRRFAQKRAVGTTAGIAAVLLAFLVAFSAFAENVRETIPEGLPTAETAPAALAIKTDSAADASSAINAATASSAPDRTGATKVQQETPTADEIKSSILLKTTGCAYIYSEADQTLTFSYGNGSVQAEFPSKWAPRVFGRRQAASLCVSPFKTAVVCKQDGLIVVVYSDDKGQTWNCSVPLLSYPAQVESGVKSLDIDSARTIKIDFVSADRGYLVIGGGFTGGTEYIHDLFTSTDGGKTWTFVASDLPAQPLSISDMHFTDGSTGYICAIGEETYRLEVWRTTDGGTTWGTRILVASSDIHSYQSADYMFSPYFIGIKGYLLIYNQSTATIFQRFLSSDNGNRWEKDTRSWSWRNPLDTGFD